MKQAYMPQSKKQEHLTPDRVYEIINDTYNTKKELLYDPCPPGTPYKAPIFFNGLYGNWQNINYINPPFNVKVLSLFVKKADEQSKLGKVCFLLLPTKTDQEWFHNFILPRLYKNPKNIFWIKKRLKFKNDKFHATDTHFIARFEGE